MDDDDLFTGSAEDDAVAWLTGESVLAPQRRGGAPPTEAAVAALRVVPPLLEAFPVLIDALVRSSTGRAGVRPGESTGWDGSAGWDEAAGAAWGEAFAAEQTEALPAPELWETAEPGWDDDGGASAAEVGFIAAAGALVPVAELGLAAFGTLREHVFNGDFSVTATPATYIHSPSPTGLAVQRRTFRFAVDAHHPRYGIDTQTFWFEVALEYDGFNIRRLAVTEDRSRSSSLHASSFTITFTPSAYTAPNEPVAAVAYSISGRWDPVGRGDESFRGSFVVDAAGTLSGLQVSSSSNWVRHRGLTSTGGGPVPRPTTARHVTTCHFDPSGSHTLTQDKIRHVHSWYTGLPTAVQAEIRKGTQVVRLTGRASTTGTVQANQALARRRADAVARVLRDLAGTSARIDIEAHGELGARTADGTEAPDERRVDLLCEYQVYAL